MNTFFLWADINFYTVDAIHYRIAADSYLIIFSKETFYKKLAVIGILSPNTFFSPVDKATHT